MPDETPIVAPEPASTPEAPLPTAPAQITAHDLHAGHHHGHAALPKFNFVEELNRRNVGRVAILYIVVSYVVLEVFEVFFHLLEMPPWSGRIAVLIAVIGLPIAILIAWAYEITPEGLKPTDEVPLQKSIAIQTGRRLDRAIIVVLCVALTYFIVDKFLLSEHVTPSAAHVAANIKAMSIAAVASDKSVAVLPFLDMSEKHDQEYFCDGLSEELINLLAQVQDLRVPARTSSFYFKSHVATVEEIGKALHVSHILEGSVRRSGDALRVTTQLVRADNGYHVWSRTFDEHSGGVFAVQDEIARAVVAALKVSLDGDRILSSARGTATPQAFDAMLRGRQFYRQFTEDGWRRASDTYQ